MGRNNTRGSQISVLGPRLLNIYLNDLCFLSECTEVCSFANDMTFHACNNDLGSLINRLEHDCLLVIEWFENNMKINKNCHLLISGRGHKNI